MAGVSKTAKASLGQKQVQVHAPKECVFVGDVLWDIHRDKKVSAGPRAVKMASKKGYTIVERKAS